MRKMIRALTLLYKEQNGTSMIFVAFCIVMLIAFTALVVDVGGLYFEKSRLQKALDAAVLGGAQLLKVSEAEAEKVAIELALENGFPVTGGEITTGVNFIEIDKTVNKKLIFARLIGFNNTGVNAFARAELFSTLIKGNGVIPVGLEEKAYKKGATYEINKKPSGEQGGNFGYLGIDGPGTLDDGIMNGSKKTVEVNKPVNTDKGGSVGQVWDGLQSRINYDKKNNPKCSNYETADYSCKRVVIVPLIKTFDVPPPAKEVLVVGFAALWIDDLPPRSEDKIKGRFIEIIMRGIFEPDKDFGIYGVKLVK